MFTGSCLLSDLLNEHWYMVKPKVVKRNKVEEKLGITVYFYQFYSDWKEQPRKFIKIPKNMEMLFQVK